MTIKRLSLAQAFGANAYQDGDKLAIAKSDLVEVGLAPSSTNTAESLLIAVLLMALKNYQGSIETDRGTLTDENGNPITYDQSSLYNFLAINFWKTQFSQIGRLDTFLIHLYLDIATDFGSATDPNI